MSQDPAHADPEAVDASYICRAPHMADAGIVVVSTGTGCATMSMPARADWIGDPVRGRLHPGVVTVLADTACGLAARAAMPRGTAVATLDLRMDYLRAARPGRELRCDARCHRVAREIAFVRASVWQGDPAEPIASAQAAFMVIGGASRGPAGAGPGDRSAGGVLGPGVRDMVAPPASFPAWIPPEASDPLPDALATPYVRYLGIRRSQGDEGTIHRLPFAPKLIGNPALPALHGGVVAGFAETAATLAVVELAPGARVPKGIDFAIDYLRSGRPEEVFAACEVVRLGSRVALAQVRCWQSGPDRPIAAARAHLLLG